MSLTDLKTIESIQFGILSSKEILARSVVEVTSAKISNDSLENTVYDPRMGVMERNKICPTCEQDCRHCPGHFGHISLSIPIIHPLLYKFVLQMLRVLCVKCSKFLVTEEFIKLHNLQKHTQNMRFQRILKLVEKSSTCLHCLETQPKITFSPTETCFLMAYKNATGKDEKIALTTDEISKRFENITDDEVRLMGFDPEMMHPKNLVFWHLPVLPPVDRPYVIADGMTCDDDITIQYQEIIKINNHLANPNTPQNKRQKYHQSIKFRVKALFDNSQNKAKHTNGRPFKGFKKRISGKEGQVRSNLMGKRVEEAARTVIGPDPTLKTGQIAIPPQVAKILTVTENINKYNLEEMQLLVDKDLCNVVTRGKSRINLKYATRTNGTILKEGDVVIRKKMKFEITDKGPWTIDFELQEGDKFKRDGKKKDIVLPGRKNFTLQIGDKLERQLRNGDIVLLNRQPTLHKGSMIAQTIVIRPGKTIRMPLAITSTFNADFDGDEMNIHVAQNHRSRTELHELSHAKHLLTSAQSSKSNLKIVQDSLLANYLMTKPGMNMTKSRFHNICCKSEWSISQINKKERRITRVLKKYNKDWSVYSGRGLFSMMLPDNFFYEKRTGANTDEPIVVIKEGTLLAGTISKSDLGGGHSSILRIMIKEYPVKVALEFIDNVQFLANEWLMYHGFSVGIKDCIATKEEEIKRAIDKCFMEATLAEQTTKNTAIKEARVNEALSKARDIGMKLAKDALRKDNNFISTVTSGSKGDFFNIAQIAGLMGQQNFSGQRIKPALNKNRRPLVHYPFSKMTQDVEYESKGFVRNSFIHGLSPQEGWFHAITGREGVTDTSMKTARTGYIQRKLIKVAEDISTHYDGTVRYANGSIVQFAYGEDGLDGSETIVRKGEPEICDMKRMIQKLNFEYEKRTLIREKWNGLIQKLGMKLIEESDKSDSDTSDDMSSSSQEESDENSSQISSSSDQESEISSGAEDVDEEEGDEEDDEEEDNYEGSSNESDEVYDEDDDVDDVDLGW